MPKTILITAGPTREFIDPVRYISNRSTGYLGYELAREAKRKGFHVILISGPTPLPLVKGIKTFHIETAKELDRVTRAHLPGADYLFMTSAVSDFHMKVPFKTKLKRRASLSLRLEKNRDILLGLSAAGLKKKKVYVGFCLETENLKQNALKKLKQKRLDFMVATKDSKLKHPFGRVNFEATVFHKNGTGKTFKAMPKSRFAKKLLALVVDK